ncbi:MAG: hypothetical protein SOZ49_04165 [Clostridiaceae bacterium]|nr:hypothetical protein [Clostridia bacterium]MDY3870422.1 hypothetical protein [Clostridiaceae bacterium]
MLKKSVLPMAALILCAVVLLVACGTALSEVFLQLRGPMQFAGM